jgi:hypothetical protein
MKFQVETRSGRYSYLFNLQLILFKMTENTVSYNTSPNKVRGYQTDDKDLVPSRGITQSPCLIKRAKKYSIISNLIHTLFTVLEG